MPSHDVFYPLMLNQDSQFQVMSNQTWPIVLSLHHNFGLKATHAIKSVESAQERNKEFYVIMSTDSGTPVVRVRYGMEFTKKGSAKGMLLSVRQHNSRDAIIESTNVRYVLKHVSSKNSDAYEAVEHLRIQAENVYVVGLTKAVKTYYNEGLSEIRQTSSTYSSKVQTDILEVLFEDKDFSTLSQEAQAELKQANKNRLKFIKDNLAHQHNVQSVFSGDKWMLLNNPYTGWHVGAVNADDLIPALLNATLDGSDSKYIKLTKMIQLVPTLHYMNPEYKDEIMGKLMVNKMANCAVGKEDEYGAKDPDHLVPTTNYLKVFSSGIISLSHCDRAWCFVPKS